LGDVFVNDNLNCMLKSNRIEFLICSAEDACVIGFITYECSFVAVALSF
jgi:hypothetical protein